METAIFILNMAMLNCLRGRGAVPADRIIFCALMGFVTLSYSLSIPIAIAVALGTYLWALPRWGKGFEAITGTISPAQGIGWIDAIVDAAIPLPNVTPGWYPALIRMRGMLWMTLRSLYCVPLFIALTALTGHIHALLGIPVCLLQGPVYWAARYLPKWERYGVAYAEIIFGAVIGTAITLAI